MKKIRTYSGNVYWLHPDNYILAEQLRAGMLVDGILVSGDPVVGEQMTVLQGSTGLLWTTSLIVSVEEVKMEKAA